jgi:RNA polymerase sigma factor (sigma-70 family)
MNDDASLLRRYAEERAEDAFTELVRRHVDLVFGAALRRTGGDSHRAADVAQQVFIQLARDARKLSRHTVLAAWLHTATRNAALNLMISEQRRKARESAAVALESITAIGESSPDWDRLRPVLDSAIDELSDTDRAAVVLRFLDRRPFSAIGEALHITEDAARMRTDRALGKLRLALSRRGITSTTAAIAAIVAGQPAMSAPAGLAALLAAKSLATVAVTATGGALTLSSLMNTTTLATAAVSALLAFGAGTYVGLTRNLDTPPPPAIETPAHSRMIASLRQENLSLKAETARLSADVSRLNSANAQHTAAPAAAPAVAKPTALLQQSAQHKATLNNLRQIAAARDQFMLEHGRPATSLDELVGDNKYIRRLIPVNGENYAGLSLLPNQPMTVVNSAGDTITFDPTQVMQAKIEVTPEMQRTIDLQKRFELTVNKAVAAYRSANNGQMPANDQALLPYFTTPQEGADFVEFIEAQKAARKP